MATLTFFQPYNMNAPADLDDDGGLLNPSGAMTATSFIVADGNYAAAVTGSGFSLVFDPFYGDWEVTSGTATSITWVDLYWGRTVYTLTGASINMALDSGYDDGYDANNDGYGELYGMRAEQAFWLQGSDSVIGSSGDDALNGYKGNDTLLGNGGNDFLSGGLGNDWLDGGSGTDYVNYLDLEGTASSFRFKSTGNLSSGSIAVYLGAATTAEQTDTVRNIELLRTTNNKDTIDLSSSTGYQDGIQSFMGNDVIIGGDVLSGTRNDGDFIDYRPFAASSFALTVDLRNTDSSTLNASAILKYSGTIIDTDKVNKIHGVIGTGGNDTVTGSAADDWFRGGAGNDRFDGGGGHDQMNYRDNATAVNITLQASTVSTYQTVNHGTGIDSFRYVEGLAGSEAGNDKLTGNDVGNILRGGGGNDTLSGGASTETNIDYTDYRNASGSISVTWSKTANSASSAGADGVDSISNIEGARGSAYNDTFVSGGKYGFVFDGRAGSDTVSFAQVGAGVKINLGLTTAQTQPVNTNLTAQYTLSNIENLVGSAFSDTLTGSSLANTLNGGSGNDNLNGGSGNDTIYGGLGNDVLTGGSGADRFVFNTTPNSSTNRDTITDFTTGSDKILLENAIFTGLGDSTFVAGDARFWVGTAAHHSSDRIIYNSTTGALLYDADGTGSSAAVQIALLGISTHPTLAATDLILI